MNKIYKNLLTHLKSNTTDTSNQVVDFLEHSELYKENLTRIRMKNGNIKLSRSESVELHKQDFDSEFQRFSNGGKMSLNVEDKKWIAKTIADQLAVSLKPIHEAIVEIRKDIVEIRQDIVEIRQDINNIVEKNNLKR